MKTTVILSTLMFIESEDVPFFGFFLTDVIRALYFQTILYFFTLTMVSIAVLHFEKLWSLFYFPSNLTQKIDSKQILPLASNLRASKGPKKIKWNSSSLRLQDFICTEYFCQHSSSTRRTPIKNSTTLRSLRFHQLQAPTTQRIFRFCKTIFFSLVCSFFNRFQRKILFKMNWNHWEFN